MVEPPARQRALQVKDTCNNDVSNVKTENYVNFGVEELITFYKKCFIIISGFNQYIIW